MWDSSSRANSVWCGRSPGCPQLAGRQVLQVPVVERPVVAELQRAQRVGHAFNRVALAVGPVIGGVDAPPVVLPVVVLVADAVHHRVAHLHVLVLHVDTGPQHPTALGVLACGHLAEQAPVLRRRPVPERTLRSRLAEAATARRDGIGVLVVDVGQTAGDQQLSPLAELLEVVRGEADLLWLEAEPPHIVDDGIDVFGILGGRVGVVEAQEAAPAEFVGNGEVEADRLRMADVEVAVRLRREAGLDPACEPG